MSNSIEIPQLRANTELEDTLLAGLIGQTEFMPDAMRLLRPEMLTGEDRQRLWEGMSAMYSQGKGISIFSVHPLVPNDRYFRELATRNTYLTPVTVQSHLDIIRDAYAKRMCYSAGLDMIRKSCDPTLTSADIVAVTAAVSEGLRNSFASSGDIKRLDRIITELGEELGRQQVEREQGRAVRIPTGIPTLDFITYSGLGAGHLVILAARPGVGKTAIMLHMAKAAAAAGSPAVIFSLEMTDQDLAQRFLFSTARVQPRDVASARIDWSEFEIAAGEFDGMPIYIDFRSRDLDEICAKAILCRQSFGCAILFVDYLQLVKTPHIRKERDDLRIGEITSRLKALAKDCGIPVVTLCQLNRDMTREKRSPELQDLKGSGSIEQDADMVLMLEAGSEERLKEVLPNTWGERNPDYTTLMWVRKNRNGRKGQICIPLVADNTFNNFREVDDRPSAPCYGYDVQEDE